MAHDRPPRQPPLASFSDEQDIAAYRSAVARYTGEPIDEEYRFSLLPAALSVSPPLCALAGTMGTLFRRAGGREGSFAHWEREWVDQVLSHDLGFTAVQATHIPEAVGTGVRAEAIAAMYHGREELLTEDEALLTRFVRGVVTGAVDDETYQLMADRLGIRGLIEYAGFILWLHWTMRMMQLIRYPETTPDEIERLIQGYSDGVLEVPDYRERIR